MVASGCSHSPGPAVSFQPWSDRQTTGRWICGRFRIHPGCFRSIVRCWVNFSRIGPDQIPVGAVFPRGKSAKPDPEKSVLYRSYEAIPPEPSIYPADSDTTFSLLVVLTTST